MVLFHIRPENIDEFADIGYTDFGQGRGWFSFIYGGEYFSFNLFNVPQINVTLILQNHGPKGNGSFEIQKPGWVDIRKFVPKPHPIGRTKPRQQRNYDPDRER